MPVLCFFFTFKKAMKAGKPLCIVQAFDATFNEEAKWRRNENKSLYLLIIAPFQLVLSVILQRIWPA